MSQSGGVSAGDLAGLTPEMISQAMQFKFAKEEMDQKKVTDLIDMIYKTSLAGEAVARTEAATPSITIPGTDIKLTGKQYVDWYKAANKDERTAAVKNYEYAQTKGYKGSFEQFQDAARTSQQKNYEQAKNEGYKGTFNEWLLSLAKAGAMNLGDLLEKERGKGEVKGQLYFTDPKGLVADVDKYVSSEEVQNNLFQYASDPRKMEVETIRAKEKFIRRKITSSGGEIVDEKLDGRTFVFTVKWSDGTTSEVRYAN